jgi:soluble lytic murein transglycosylase-like protein
VADRAARLARYDRWTREAAARSRIDWLLVKAVRIKESFNDPNYISTTGAVGLMQLMPCGGGRMFVTANYRNFLRARRNGRGRSKGKPHSVWALAYRRDLQRLVARTRPPELYRKDRRFDPRWNIARGAAHLARDLARFKRRYPRAPRNVLLQLAVAAYFTGPGRVALRRGKVVLSPSRTRHYLEDTMQVYARLKAGLPGR